jgi:hypothetical protein
MDATAAMTINTIIESVDIMSALKPNYKFPDIL